MHTYKLKIIQDVYVVGDNIFYIPEGEERPVPQMVENAEHSAPVVAHNIAADIKGGEYKTYKPTFPRFNGMYRFIVTG